MINSKNPAVSILRRCMLVLPLVLMICIMVSPAHAVIPLKVKTVVVDTPLTAFEGIYQNQPNTFAYFKVSVKNDTLVAKQMGGDRQIVLTHKSGLEFSMKDDDGDEDIPVVFSKNDAGEISKITVGGRDEWMKVKEYVPVTPVKLDAAQLQALEGKYEFEQKQGVYLQITATTDGLRLKQLWDNREIDFVALSDTDFTNVQMMFPLKFTKGTDGKGLKVLAFNRDMWDKVKE
ncbi:MAG: hypothetical protein JST50_00440 [Bacteroidetes bacterium]|jgi:hypothetical protein|nr:hypothetical protein [Bacteroidota bacterium]